MYWTRIKKGETLPLPAKLNGFSVGVPEALRLPNGIGEYHWCGSCNVWHFVLYGTYTN